MPKEEDLITDEFDSLKLDTDNFVIQTHLVPLDGPIASTITPQPRMTPTLVTLTPAVQYPFMVLVFLSFPASDITHNRCYTHDFFKTPAPHPRKRFCFLWVDGDRYSYPKIKVSGQKWLNTFSRGLSSFRHRLGLNGAGVLGFRPEAGDAYSATMDRSTTRVLNGEWEVFGVWGATEQRKQLRSNLLSLSWLDQELYFSRDDSSVA
jgi:hypothetical protein